MNKTLKTDIKWRNFSDRNWDLLRHYPMNIVRSKLENAIRFAFVNPEVKI